MTMSEIIMEPSSGFLVLNSPSLSWKLSLTGSDVNQKTNIYQGLF